MTLPYTEDEQKELSEIVQAFNERHGTEFSEEDMLRFERVNRDLMNDYMTAMLRNNPPDVGYGAFAQAFFQGAIQMFQKDNEMRNIVMLIPRRGARRHGTFSIARFARHATASDAVKV